MGVFVVSALAIAAADQMLKAAAARAVPTGISGFVYRQNPLGGMAGVSLLAGSVTLVTAAACMVTVSAVADVAIGLGAASAVASLFASTIP